MATTVASTSSLVDQLKALLNRLGLKSDQILELGWKKVLALLIVTFFGQQTIGRRLMDKAKGMPPGPLPMPMIGT